MKSILFILSLSLISHFSWADSSIKCSQIQGADDAQMVNNIFKVTLFADCNVINTNPNRIKIVQAQLEKNIQKYSVESGPTPVQDSSGLSGVQYIATEFVDEHSDGTVNIRRQIDLLSNENSMIYKSLTLGTTGTGNATLTKKNDWDLKLTNSSPGQISFRFSKSTDVEKKGPTVIFKHMVLSSLKQDFTGDLSQYETLFQN